MCPSAYDITIRIKVEIIWHGVPIIVVHPFGSVQDEVSVAVCVKIISEAIAIGIIRTFFSIGY